MWRCRDVELFVAVRLPRQPHSHYMTCQAHAQDRGGLVRSGLAGIWGVVPAWSATLLFGFQPVAQVVSCRVPVFDQYNACMRRSITAAG